MFMFRFILVCLLAVAITCAVPCKLAAQTASAASASLEVLYNTAISFQKAGSNAQAGLYYRRFLASALDELANSHSWTGDYRGALPLFSEALVLTPHSAPIELDYARLELSSGDLIHAEALARQTLSAKAATSGEQAESHQILGLALHRMNSGLDARRELESAVALDPSFTNRYDLAVICLDLDDEACAEHNFSAIEATSKDTPALHMRLGLAYGNSDFTSRAVAEFKKVIAEDPRYPEAHYCIAAALLAAGEDAKTLAEAEAQLKAELAITPNDFLTYAALGKIDLSYHRYAEAERYLRRAISLNAKNPDAFLYLGQLDYETHRFSEAEINLRKAIQLTSDVSRNHYQIQKAHFLLGRILMQEHHELEAHAEMQIAQTLTNKALNKDKNNLSGMVSGGESQDALSNSSIERQVTSVSKLADPGALRRQRALEAELTPAIADSYNNLGAMAASSGKYADAVRYFQHAAKWNPSLEGLDYNLGRAAFMASDYSTAILPLAYYLHSHPREPAILGALAMSQFMTNHYGACLLALRQAGETVTSIPQMQYIYAESLVKTGQISAGLMRLQSLEAAHPEIAEVHRAIGEVDELRGDQADAIRELRQAIRLRDGDPESHYDLGKAELDTGDIAAAIGELETATRLDPKDARFHRELAVAYERAFRITDAEKERSIARQLQTSRDHDSRGQASPAAVPAATPSLPASSGR